MPPHRSSIRLRSRALDSPRLIGRSPAITKLRARIPQLAANSEPLVIIGETGVGKTLFAKVIHAQSTRKATPLRSINFNILSEREQRVALLGGGPPELTTTRRSYLEFPTTLLLKHIDLANAFLQEQLAQALKDRRFTRLGTESAQFVLSRPIFLLGSSPRTLSRRGALVDPLYSLLHQYKQVIIPPLRKRPLDIPILAQHFIDGFIQSQHLSPERIAHVLTRKGKLNANLGALLLGYEWKENATELKAYLKCLIPATYRQVFDEQEGIELMKMLLKIEEGSEFSLRASLSILETNLIQRTLRSQNSNQAKAAQLLGISDRAFRRNKQYPCLT